MQVLKKKVKQAADPLVEYLLVAPQKQYIFRGVIIKTEKDLNKTKKILDLTEEEVERIRKYLIPEKSIVLLGGIYSCTIDILNRKVKVKELVYPVFRPFPKENAEKKIIEFLKAKALKQSN